MQNRFLLNRIATSSMLPGKNFPKTRPYTHAPVRSKHCLREYQYGLYRFYGGEISSRWSITMCAVAVNIACLRPRLAAVVSERGALADERCAQPVLAAMRCVA